MPAAGRGIARRCASIAPAVAGTLATPPGGPGRFGLACRPRRRRRRPDRPRVGRGGRPGSSVGGRARWWSSSVGCGDRASPARAGRRRGARRTSSTKRRRPASTTPTTGDYPVRRRWRRGGLRLRRRRRAGPVPRRRRGAGRAVPQRERARRDASLRAGPAAATDLDAVTGAYPLDIDGDGLVDLAVLRLGENVILRGLGDCRFERANERLGLSTAATPGPSASARPGRTRPTLPTLAFGRVPRAWTRPANRRPTAPTARWSARPTVTARRTRRRSRWRPAGARCPCCSATGTAPAGATCASATTATTTATARSSSGGSRPASRRAPTRRDDGWARLRLWGMGIASQDLTGDGYPEVYLTSQGDNKLQTLADGPPEPAYEDIALRPRRHGPPAVRGRRCPAVDRLAPGVRRRQQRRLPRPVRQQGQRRARDRPRDADPSNLLIGQADGTFVEGAEAAGIMRFGLARGAALVDLNLDGLLDLVQVVRNEPVELWRNVGSGDATAPARWATGSRWTSSRTAPTATPSAPGSRPGSAIGSSSAR